MKKLYRVTYPKNGGGPVRRTFKGGAFDRRQENEQSQLCRVKRMTLSEAEAADAVVAGFKLLELKDEEATPGEPLTSGGKKKAAKKKE